MFILIIVLKILIQMRYLAIDDHSLLKTIFYPSGLMENEGVGLYFYRQCVVDEIVGAVISLIQHMREEHNISAILSLHRLEDDAVYSWAVTPG